MNAPTIETAHLILCAIRPDDWEPYAAMWADPRVSKYIGGKPRARDVAWPKFVQGAGFWSLFGYGYWSIFEQGGGYVGVGGFAQHERGIEELHGYPECGWIFVPDSWGKGIASEAVGAMVDWADQTLGVETRCLISNANIASVRVAQRSGYVELGAVADNAKIFQRIIPNIIKPIDIGNQIG